MVAPFPSVDERRARELFAELEYMARAFLPGWSGATAEGDAGHALLQIAARLGEQVTYRLDKTPRRDTIAFFDALDIPPQAPGPGIAVCSTSSSSASVILPPDRAPTASKTDTISRRFAPGRIVPP